jgi:hypothetical protein
MSKKTLNMEKTCDREERQGSRPTTRRKLKTRPETRKHQRPKKDRESRKSRDREWNP